jgi:hypothetical protein
MQFLAKNPLLPLVLRIYITSVSIQYHSAVMRGIYMNMVNTHYRSPTFNKRTLLCNGIHSSPPLALPGRQHYDHDHYSIRNIYFCHYGSLGESETLM